MRYEKPSITATYTATSAIQSRKGLQVREMGSINFTAGPGYQSEE